MQLQRPVVKCVPILDTCGEAQAHQCRACTGRCGSTACILLWLVRLCCGLKRGLLNSVCRAIDCIKCRAGVEQQFGNKGGDGPLVLRSMPFTSVWRHSYIWVIHQLVDTPLYKADCARAVVMCFVSPTGYRPPCCTSMCTLHRRCLRGSQKRLVGVVLRSVS